MGWLGRIFSKVRHGWHHIASKAKGIWHKYGGHLKRWGQKIWNGAHKAVHWDNRHFIPFSGYLDNAMTHAEDIWHTAKWAGKKALGLIRRGHRAILGDESRGGLKRNLLSSLDFNRFSRHKTFDTKPPPRKFRQMIPVQKRMPIIQHLTEHPIQHAQSFETHTAKAPYRISRVHNRYSSPIPYPISRTRRNISSGRQTYPMSRM